MIIFSCKYSVIQCVTVTVKGNNNDAIVLDVITHLYNNNFKLLSIQHMPRKGTKKNTKSIN